jgi:hypothetical protein
MDLGDSIQRVDGKVYISIADTGSLLKAKDVPMTQNEVDGLRSFLSFYSKSAIVLRQRTLSKGGVEPFQSAKPVVFILDRKLFTSGAYCLATYWVYLLLIQTAKCYCMIKAPPPTRDG